MYVLKAQMNEGRQVYMNVMLLMIMMYGETWFVFVPLCIIYRNDTLFVWQHHSLFLVEWDETKKKW